MRQIFDWAWVETQVASVADIWNGCAYHYSREGRRYSPAEQAQRERAYDEALKDVEQELKRKPRTKAERIEMQRRIVATFGQFSARALHLDDQATELLIHDFLPVGTKLARWAREFDQTLSMADIIQACRNAWTACGLQPLLGVAVGLTPSILGYSLLYPYSDNYLDQETVSAESKLRFSQRFRQLLRGEAFAPANCCEEKLRALVQLVEGQYPRALYPEVFDCLLAIHQAQEHSIQQVSSLNHYDDKSVLRLSCGKGGSSVLADACLATGRLNEQESRFAFEWGVLLQLGDDLQDVREDMRRGSVTLFSRAAGLGRPLEGLAIQLLNFADHVASSMDGLPNGNATLKDLLKMSWRSLIIRAVADSGEFFSAAFVQEAERRSPFRFAFLRARQERLVAQQGLYAMLFEAFLEQPEGEKDGLELPVHANARAVSTSHNPRQERRCCQKINLVGTF